MRKLVEISPVSGEELCSLAVQEGFFAHVESAGRDVHGTLAELVHMNRIRQLADGKLVPVMLSQTLTSRGESHIARTANDVKERGMPRGEADSGLTLLCGQPIDFSLGWDPFGGVPRGMSAHTAHEEAPYGGERGFFGSFWGNRDGGRDSHHISGLLQPLPLD